jgi:hypothetical protein
VRLEVNQTHMAISRTSGAALLYTYKGSVGRARRFHANGDQARSELVADTKTAELPQWPDRAVLPVQQVELVFK